MSSTMSSKPKLPAHYEVRIGKRLGELALFWQRREGDALAVLAGLVLLGRPVTVRHVEAAIEVLREHEGEGARRMIQMMESRLVDRTDERPPWYVDVLPETVSRRVSKDGKKYPCGYFIEPTTKLQCRNEGAFVVPGARGTFCALHAHRTVSRVARRNARARKP